MMGIYCFTNKINNKKYIGQSLNIEKRYLDHKSQHLNKNYKTYNTSFYMALRKYGFFNFTFEILEEIHDINILSDREQFWIKKLESYKYGYNMTTGGETGPMSNPETSKKISGENHYLSLLNNDEVYYIREQYLIGKSKQDIYKEFESKMTFSCFKSVWWGITYKNVHMDVYEKRKKHVGKKGKLDIQEVLSIREKYMKGISVEALIEEYNKVTKYTIKNILALESWKRSEAIPNNYIPWKRMSK